MEYTFSLPEIVKVERKVRYKISDYLVPGNILIICGKHSEKSINEEIVPLLSKFGKVTLFSNMPKELPLSFLEDVLAIARKEKVSNIIGWGGGSAIDAAKAVAALVDLPGSCEDYFYDRLTCQARTNNFIALPTTAGTGAEVTANSVIWDEKTNVKKSLRAPKMTADVALVDPELLYNSPKEVIASAGFDALTQAIESYISIKSDAVTMQLAFSGIFLLINNLLPAINGDIQAYDLVARGSVTTGMAFSRSGLGAVHGIAHPLGSIRRIPHGVACAILLPSILTWNMKEAGEKIQELALALGFKGAADFIAKLVVLRSQCGLPGFIEGSNLTKEERQFILKECRSGSMKCNPRVLSDSDVEAILDLLVS
jgi:alcohol dehydrogenase class IV